MLLIEEAELVWDQGAQGTLYFLLSVAVNIKLPLKIKEYLVSQKDKDHYNILTHIYGI